MRMKSRLLLPAGVLAAAFIGRPAVPPPDPARRTHAAAPGRRPAVRRAPASAGPGPDSPTPSLPGASTAGRWPPPSSATSSTSAARSTTPCPRPVVPHPRAKLAAFCLADGKLRHGFRPNFGAAAINTVNALATDGTSLFVGGNFTALNGSASTAWSSSTPDWWPHQPGSPRRPSAGTRVLDLRLLAWHGVLYAGR